MARPKKTYQTPVIEQVTAESTVVEKPVEIVEKKVQPVLIAKDDSVITRKAPTLSPSHVVGKLAAGCSYKIRKSVDRTIYGDFYLLENGLYVAKVGNFTVK